MKTKSNFTFIRTLVASILLTLGFTGSAQLFDVLDEDATGNQDHSEIERHSGLHCIERANPTDVG